MHVTDRIGDRQSRDTFQRMARRSQQRYRDTIRDTEGVSPGKERSASGIECRIREKFLSSALQ
jgi:hypothetical protein